MSKQINKTIVEDIATELVIHPSFIEKDFYAVKVLDTISQFSYENAKLVFTGGTSLSKGYKLIKRFSEDIDFRVITNPSFTRSQRKTLRETIIQNLKAIPDLKFLDATLKKKNESKFFSFYIEYPKTFDVDTSLREDLKLEFTFENNLLPIEKCNIQSLIDEFTRSEEKIEIDCISPVEIGANKVSALMWRLDIRNRNKNQGDIANDSTIIRHLHDLSALERLILNNNFISAVKQSFDADKGRSGSNNNILLAEFAEQTLNKLKIDNLYAKEYENYVEVLSYASDAEAIDFKTALASFERIVDFIKTN